MAWKHASLTLLQVFEPHTFDLHQLRDFSQNYTEYLVEILEWGKGLASVQTILNYIN